MRLREALELFTEIPIHSLTQEKQQSICHIFSEFFIPLHLELLKEELQTATSARIVATIISLIQKDPIDEYLFAQQFLKLLKSLQTEKNDDAGLRILQGNLSTILTRSEEFAMAEQRAREMRQTMTRDQIRKYDRDHLAKTMQLYALDYFLCMDQVLNATDDREEKERFLREGTRNLPILREDALTNDMLTKVVYAILQPNLRNQLIKDFLNYKTVFSEEKSVEEIILALRQYCRTLLKISLSQGIHKIEFGILYPYPKGTSLNEILTKLN